MLETKTELIESRAKYIRERNEAREQLTAARAAVATMRNAIVKASTDQYNTGRGRTDYCTYCLICGSIGCTQAIKHTPDCYVGQALAAADAVLGEATP